MDHEERNNSNKGYRRMKAIMHLAMGTFYILISIALFYLRKFGQIELSVWVAYALGSVLIVYGIFRIWRGWTDMNSKD